MTTLSVISENTLHQELRDAISEAPQQVSDLVEGVMAKCRVDREEVIAAMWDLVEDEGLIYDAGARIRRHA